MLPTDVKGSVFNFLNAPSDVVCSASDPRPGDGVLWWEESPAALTGSPYNEPSSLDESLAPFEARCLSTCTAVGWWWWRWWWWWSWSIKPNMPPRPGRKSSIMSLPEDECAVPPWWCDPLLKFNCLENRAGKMLCGWCGSPPDTPFRSIAVPVTVRRVAKRRRCSARVQARGSGDGSDAVVATGVLMRMHCVTWRHGRNFYWNCYYMYYIDTRLYIIYIYIYIQRRLPSREQTNQNTKTTRNLFIILRAVIIILFFYASGDISGRTKIWVLKKKRKTLKCWSDGDYDLNWIGLGWPECPINERARHPMPN